MEAEDISVPCFPFKTAFSLYISGETGCWVGGGGKAGGMWAVLQSLPLWLPITYNAQSMASLLPQGQPFGYTGWEEKGLVAGPHNSS